MIQRRNTIKVINVRINGKCKIKSQITRLIERVMGCPEFHVKKMIMHNIHGKSKHKSDFITVVIYILNNIYTRQILNFNKGTYFKFLQFFRYFNIITLRTPTSNLHSKGHKPSL